MGGLRMGVSPVPRRLAWVPGTAHLRLAGAWGATLGLVLSTQNLAARTPLFISWSSTDLGWGAHLPGPYSSSSKVGKIMAPTPTSDHTSWHQA